MSLPALKVRAQERLQGAEELVLALEQVDGRQQWMIGVAAQQVVAGLRVGPEVANRVGGITLGCDDGAFGRIAGRDGGLVEEQRR